MSTFNYPIEIGDPQGTRFERIEALVDAGASHTLVPATLLQKLGGKPIRRAVFALAGGRRIERDMGETRVRVDGQTATRLVIFGHEGEQPLIGSDTLEGLLLAVGPVSRRLVPTHGLLMASTPTRSPV